MTELSVTEYAVLGVLAEDPRHGFALSRLLRPDGEVGRVFTVRRPLVYRALDRLVGYSLAEPVLTERGDSGPKRVIHRVTPRGWRQLRDWLEEPVDHVRDMRIQFLLKLTILGRAGISPARLVEAQRSSLKKTLAALEDPDTNDPVELWRQHNARAAGAYLEELQTLYGP